MEGLEALLIDAKVLALMQDALQQPIAVALKERLGSGGGAVYCSMALVSSVRLQGGKKTGADAAPAQRRLHEASGSPRR